MTEKSSTAAPFDPRRFKSPVALSAVVIAAFAIGCGSSGPELAKVHGRVTYRGKPIEQGTIVFFPMGETKGRQAGAKIVNGEYAINENGPVMGTYRVEIQAYRKTGRKVPDVMGDVSNPNRPLVDETIPILPVTFNLESQLTADITSSDNTKDFDL